jgi:hypothetical protein
MTISLAVILLECTGDYQIGLPLMISLMTARFTGNLFNEGIFDMIIHLRKWPVLEEHAKKSFAAKLSVRDVMVPNPVTLPEVLLLPPPGPPPTQAACLSSPTLFRSRVSLSCPYLCSVHYVLF